MAAKVMPIKNARRLAEVDVMKLICNCDPTAFQFRVTVIGEQVVAECGLCLQDYGPFFLKQSVVLPPDEKEAGEA